MGVQPAWRYRSALVLAIAAVGLAGCAGGRHRSATDVARPDVKVVVLDVAHANGEVRGALLDILGERYAVVDDADYRRTARRLGARTMRARHVARVARALGIDAIAYGTLVKARRDRYSLRVSVRDGDRGRLLARFTLPVHEGRISRSRLTRSLYGALDGVAPDPDEPMPEPGGAPGPADGPEPERGLAAKPARASKPAAVANAAPTAKPAPATRPAPATKRVPASVAEREPAPKPVLAAKPPRRPRTRPAADAAVATDDPTGSALPPVATDEDGQAIDDELPPGL